MNGVNQPQQPGWQPGQQNPASGPVPQSWGQQGPAGGPVPPQWGQQPADQAGATAPWGQPSQQNPASGPVPQPWGQQPTEAGPVPPGQNWGQQGPASGPVPQPWGRQPAETGPVPPGQNWGQQGPASGPVPQPWGQHQTGQVPPGQGWNQQPGQAQPQPAPGPGTGPQPQQGGQWQPSYGGFGAFGEQKPKRSKKPFLIGAAVVVLLGGGGVGAWLLGAFQGDTLDQAAVQDGVVKILREDFGEGDVKNAQCPDDQPVRTGTTFECTVTVAGQPKKVTVRVLNDQAQYEVGMPR